MNNTVFNTNHRTNTFMFFGDDANISRYDVMQHPIFHKLTEKQKGFFWQPTEIDVTKDARDFKILSDSQKFCFTETISYQSMLDSVQGRSPALALLPHCSLPELEACITWWCAMEQMHNESYAYLIRNVYADPTRVFDGILSNTDIVDRAKKTVLYYDDFINYSLSYRLLGGDLTELKKKLILCMVAINALEGLSFYASFACSFAFAEQGLMEGNAKIISLIMRDENLHLAITQNVINKWRNGDDDPEMQLLYQELLPEIREIYENVVTQEKEWASHLFQHGSKIGLNERILVEYVEYMAGKRMKNIGLKTEYTTKNPLSWMDKYTNSGDTQVGPQEVEISSYIIGGVKNDIASTDMSNFL